MEPILITKCNICVLTILASILITPAPKVPTLLALNKGDNTVSILNLETGKSIKTLPTGPNPNEVAVSPDGTVAAISDMGASQANPGKTITLVDIPAAKIKSTISIEAHGMPHGITWLTNDRLAFTSHVTDSLVELDVKSGKVLRHIATEQKGTHLAVFDKGSRNAFAVNAFSGTVTAIDFQKGTIRKQIPSGDRAEGISISPDNKWVACGNLGANSISIIEPTKLEVSRTITGIGAPIRTVFTADSQHLLASSVSGGTVEVYATKDWTKVASVDLKQKPIADERYGKQWPTPMNFWVRKNGNILVVLVTSHAVAEIDPKTWRVVKTYDTGPVPDGIAVAE